MSLFFLVTVLQYANEMCVVLYYEFHFETIVVYSCGEEIYTTDGRLFERWPRDFRPFWHEVCCPGEGFVGEGGVANESDHPGPLLKHHPAAYLRGFLRKREYYTGIAAEA